ncbi:hypothetical protein [Rhodococcus koreensis]
MLSATSIITAAWVGVGKVHRMPGEYRRGHTRAGVISQRQGCATTKGRTVLGLVEYVRCWG